MQCGRHMMVIRAGGGAVSKLLAAVTSLVGQASGAGRGNTGLDWGCWSINWRVEREGQLTRTAREARAGWPRYNTGVVGYGMAGWPGPQTNHCNSRLFPGMVWQSQLESLCHPI